jgi:hypothetical protein
MKKILTSTAIFLLTIGFLTHFAQTRKLNSAAATLIKDTLSTSQLSYFAVLSSGNTAGDSIINISTTLGPSKTTNNLFIGDTLAIGVGDSMHIYTVKDIGNTASISLNVGVSAVDLSAGAVAIATRSAVHTISFNPQSNVASGRWQFLIKSTDGTDESYNDGIPDQKGFDLGAGANTLAAGDVTCPWGASASVGTTTSITSGTPSVTNYYHIIQCALPVGGTNPTTGTGTVVIGNTNKLINPTKGIGNNVEGYADLYTFYIRHTDSSGVQIEPDAQGKIALIEAVRVTATVDPTLTFTIDTTDTIGSTACGPDTTLSSAQANVTATAVPFGSVAIGSTANQLAQRLGVITNGASYVVTAYENKNMEITNGTGTTIPDTNCNGACTPTSATVWTTVDTANSEWGYTMAGTGVPFTAYNFKPFGLGSANAQSVMANASTPIATEYSQVCYRLTVNTTQRAGDYENGVIYTATATF